MALPSSGAIDLGSIRTTFGKTGEISLFDLYDNKIFYGPSVPFVPSSGEISLSNYYGKCNIPQPLTAAALSNCQQAYGLRRLTSNYTGPLFGVRRSGDDAYADVYGDVNGVLGLSANGRGTALSNFLGNNVGYIHKWYSQLGNGHFIQTNNPEQAVIDRVNNEYKIYFGGSNNFYLETAYYYYDNFSFHVKAKPARGITIYEEANTGVSPLNPENKLLWAVHGGDTTGGMGLNLGTNGVDLIQHGSAYYPRVLSHSNNTDYANASNVDVLVTFSNLIPKYYLNRAFIKNGQTSLRPVFFYPQRIGRGSYGWYNGHVQEMIVWDRELSASQVAALQN